MVEILHDLMYIHIYVYHTTRIPILLVYEVYLRSCRISTINSSSVALEKVGSRGHKYGKFKTSEGSA